MLGLGTGHGRVYAEGAGLVGASGDHSPSPGVAADNNGLPSQFGMVPLLDRGKEGVHIKVDDFPGQGHGGQTGLEGGSGFRSTLTQAALAAIIGPDNWLWCQR